MKHLTSLFGRLSGEFIRTQVIPEIDALRFAEIFQMKH